jgi:GNAT superfamily N-acetyltransferase
MPLRVQSLNGDAIQPYLADLARLRIEIFRDYPYLYDGDETYENNYLQNYAASPDSLIVIAFDDDKVVGAATAMPLYRAAEEVQHPFLAQNLPLEQIFYLGESVLQQQYRGQGIGVKFFEEREAYARSMNANYAVFCAVERPLIHPRRPIDYVPLDKFWYKRGYQKRAELHTAFAWKEIDEAKPSEKPMIFWMKRFR